MPGAAWPAPQVLVPHHREPGNLPKTCVEVSMSPESANEQNASTDNAPSPSGVSPVLTANMQALLQLLRETPGLHGSHVPRYVEEGQEPVTSLILQLDTSEAQTVQQDVWRSQGGDHRVAWRILRSSADVTARSPLQGVRLLPSTL